MSAMFRITLPDGSVREVAPGTTPADVAAAIGPGLAKAALAAIHAIGPRVVLVTSLVTGDTPADCIDLMAGEGGRFWRMRTPRLHLDVNGAGDAIAALFLVHYARTGSAALALGMAAASIHGLLRRTAEAGSDELLTVAAQEEFVAPSAAFPVEIV